MIEFILNVFKGYLNFLISNYFSIMEFSIITKMIVLALIVLYFYAIVKSIKFKPIEGVTKGKVWITYVIIYAFFGIAVGIFGFFVMGAIYIVIQIVLGEFARLHWPFREIGCVVILSSFMFGSYSIFMTQTEEYLSNKENIGREEATTTKKYILLLLKMVGTVLLIIFALPFALIGVAGYFLLKCLGITGSFLQDKFDNETLHTYERQKIEGVAKVNGTSVERRVTEEEAEMARERQELKKQRK